MTEKCPTCKTLLQLEPPLEINQTVICSNCGMELEIIWLYPLELAKVLSYNPDPSRKKKQPRQGSKKR